MIPSSNRTSWAMGILAAALQSRSPADSVRRLCLSLVIGTIANPFALDHL
jgi:hypothetical protein